LIFGGEQKWNLTLQYRECLNDVRLFDPVRNTWKLIKSIGKVIAPRRDHAAAANDKMMCVYGGISHEGVYLRDTWTLNLSKNMYPSNSRKQRLERSFPR
jgi:N-acetylneuraminic acid mutarotase